MSRNKVLKLGGGYQTYKCENHFSWSQLRATWTQRWHWALPNGTMVIVIKIVQSIPMPFSFWICGRLYFFASFIIRCVHVTCFGQWNKSISDMCHFHSEALRASCMIHYFLLPAEDIVEAHVELEWLSLDPTADPYWTLAQAKNFCWIEPLRLWDCLLL